MFTCNNEETLVGKTFQPRRDQQQGLLLNNSDNNNNQIIIGLLLFLLMSVNKISVPMYRDFFGFDCIGFCLLHDDSSSIY